MITYLAAYQSFTNVKEMDLHIQKHITKNYEYLNETDRTLITVLSQYACKFPGAAHLKVETMCKAIKKSEATVRRTMRKLQELQIIKKIHTIRKVLKGYGANIIVILPYDDMSKVIAREDAKKPVTASNAEDFSEKETFISLSSKKELLHNTYIPEKPSNHHLWISLIKRRYPQFINNSNPPFFQCLDKTNKWSAVCMEFIEA